MEISATYKGEAVTIVDIDANGSSVYVTYKDASNNLIVDRNAVAPTSATSLTIATSATGA